MTMWLTGMMGTGKSSAGLRAAASLGVPFHDTDVEVSAASGSSIQELWESIGEEGFRDLERAMVSRLAGAEAIVATGGGVVLDRRNREVMSGSGTVIWLQASPEALMERIGDDGERPLISGSPDPLAALEGIAAARSELYRELADHAIDTSHRSVDDVAGEIEALWVR
jgi:shikimate kinase